MRECDSRHLPQQANRDVVVVVVAVAIASDASTQQMDYVLAISDVAAETSATVAGIASAEGV